MKKFRETAAKVLSYVYGIGIAVALFAGALSVIGYVVAMIAGGDTATEICKFIYKDFYPVIVYLSSITVLLGLVKMYVAGEKSLVPPKKKK
ncbi:MAG: hypothetical protein E7589_07205 [Ruminococcaceae bacterium]|nr:hypothetical protein [Oscillospiraceae bacterium]